MNGYKCFYNGKSINIYANTSYEAQQKTMTELRVPKSKVHMISVCLCEIEDKQVVTTITN